MVDPILGLPELSEGNPLNVTDQNRLNLLLLRLALDPRIAANNLSAPPGSVVRGQAWIISGTATGLWAGHAALTVAVALSDNPTSASGWFFYTPPTGFRCWVIAGSPTGHLVFNGTSFVAV